MDAQSLSAEFQSFEDRLNDFYDAFHKSKNAIIAEASGEPTRVENERLRKDLRAAQDDNWYLKEDLENLRKKVVDLEQELKVKGDLLSAIGAYARQDASSNPVGASPGQKRGRERSPERESDLARKRSRDARKYQSNRASHDSKMHEGSDSGFVTASPHSHASQGRPVSTAPSIGNTPYIENALRQAYPQSQLRNDLKDLQHSPIQIQSTSISIAGAANKQGNDPKHPNGTYHRRPRRLVCHQCYSKRIKCDNALTCRNCEINGTECVRSLCAAYHSSDQGCYRISGDCFKIHGEQGYNTVDFDPFKN